jgi:hypothetical protein
LSVVDHLSVCEECRRQVEEAVDGEAAYLALKTGVFDETAPRSSPAERSHLSFEQLAGLVDGTVSGEELQTVKDHLAWCEECELEVEDLRAFKDHAAPDPQPCARPQPVNAMRRGLWTRLAAGRSSGRPKSPAFVFCSALAVLLVITIGWVAWRGRRVEPRMAMATPSASAVPIAAPASTPNETAIFLARLNDGEGQVALDQEGRLSGADQLPPAYQEMVKRALAGRQLERSPLLARLTGPRITPRGDGDAGNGEFSVSGPVGVIMLSDRPTFRWSRLDGATDYVVEVYDHRFNLTMTSPQITGNSWTAAQPLERGGDYYWQVKAVKDGEELKAPRESEGRAKFHLLDEATAGELARARRAYASSHLALGLLFAQAGVLDDAEQEFRALQRANPDSAVPGQLLTQVRAMRRVNSSKHSR